MTSSRAIVSLMIFVVVAAAMLTAREDAPRAGVEPLQVAPMAMAVDDTPRPQKTNTAVVTAAATNAVVTNAVVTKTATTATPEPAAAPVNQAVEPQLEPESVAAAVTITGCLERGEGTFRLTDASGSDAPTKRSWKSGFLKKRAAHVELADGVGTLNLRNHVGRRVAATGTLVDRELRARSVRFVGPCE